MAIEIRILQSQDIDVLSNVAQGVFDDLIDTARTREYLADQRHHLVVAMDDDLVVGFLSALDYVHPDKPRPELWINEIGVASAHRGRGIGKDLLRELLELGARLGCTEAWVTTERSNTAATRLYSALGGLDGSDDAVLFTFKLRD